MTMQQISELGGEFALIRQFFTHKSQNQQVDCAVGDDAALFRVADGMQCVVSSDMLVSGKHFFADVAPRDLGHKALAVNLSDLAAMGAEPIGFTLSLALPSMKTDWVREFSMGLLALAREFNCDLIGGDTTQSPHLVINITVLGQLPVNLAIRRDGAQVGDDIWVSGDLGAAAYALSLIENPMQITDPSVLQQIRQRLERPQPKVALGIALREVAHSMLDLSDGLAGDLVHILEASRVRAQVDCDALPLHPILQNLPTDLAWRYALTGGDDYELCLTAPVSARQKIIDISHMCQIPLTRIGQVLEGSSKIDWCSAKSPQLLDNMQQWMGYNHFVESK